MFQLLPASPLSCAMAAERSFPAVMYIMRQQRKAWERVLLERSLLQHAHLLLHDAFVVWGREVEVLLPSLVDSSACEDCFRPLHDTTDGTDSGNE